MIALKRAWSKYPAMMSSCFFRKLPHGKKKLDQSRNHVQNFPEIIPLDKWNSLVSKA